MTHACLLMPITYVGPVPIWYGMREALAVLCEEGLPAMWKRHQEVHELLWEGLKGLGLQSYVPKVGGGGSSTGPPRMGCPAPPPPFHPHPSPLSRSLPLL